MDWFSTLPGLEKAYVLCAILGGGILVVQFILSLIGGADADVDLDIEVDLDHGGGDLSVQWLSVQSFSSFFMMFGLTGMVIIHEFHKSELKSFVGATMAGFATGWFVYKMFAAMKNLETSGNINMNNAVGKEGRVYLTVKGNETGRVEIVIQGKLGVYDAISENKEEITTGEQVKVVRVINDTTLSVVRI